MTKNTTIDRHPATRKNLISIGRKLLRTSDVLRQYIRDYENFIGPNMSDIEIDRHESLTKALFILEDVGLELKHELSEHYDYDSIKEPE
jgi:hypothetical protein